MMTTPKYKIRPAVTTDEAITFFSFAQKGQRLPKNHPRNNDYYIKQFVLAPDLLLGAFIDKTLIGVLLGGLETHQVLIGEFYIEPKYQKLGIGSQMLRTIEKNVIKHNIHHIYLGADPKAESFYLKNNYIPELFVQLYGNMPKDNIDSLINKYPNYHVIWRQDNLNNSKVIFQTNGLDIELQANIKKVFPKANTVYLFTKDL